MAHWRKTFSSLKTIRNLSTLASIQARQNRSRWRWMFNAVGVSALSAAAAYYNVNPVFAATIKETHGWMSDPVTAHEEMEQNSDDMRVKMEKMVMGVQADVCRALEKEEGGKLFTVDKWEREQGGGGITCVMQDGEVFEKAGVNVSVVHGNLPPAAIREMKSRGKKLEGKNLPFFATGVSCVVHPRNPNVPTIHFNYRYFEVTDETGKKHWWFGGGTDLTPYFLDEQDIVHFHQTLKTACDKHDKSYYPRFKKWCDEYFFIKHRDQSRGVGGIFFDDMEDESPEKIFQFASSCGSSVVPSYIPLVEKNKTKNYSTADREWQLLRRGYYTEFNLVYDRGTKFGLYTPGARIESILMSLPLSARWEYCHEVKPGSPEQKLTDILRNPRDWV